MFASLFETNVPNIPLLKTNLLSLVAVYCPDVFVFMFCVSVFLFLFFCFSVSFVGSVFGMCFLLLFCFCLVSCFAIRL